MFATLFSASHTGTTHPYSLIGKLVDRAFRCAVGEEDRVVAGRAACRPTVREVRLPAGGNAVVRVRKRSGLERDLGGRENGPIRDLQGRRSGSRRCCCCIAEGRLGVTGVRPVHASGGCR